MSEITLSEEQMSTIEAARAGKWDDGRPKDPIGHGIYAKDLNGDSMQELTPELLAQLGIELEIADW